MQPRAPGAVVGTTRSEDKVAALRELYDELLERRPAPGPATATAASA